MTSGMCHIIIYHIDSYCIVSYIISYHGIVLKWQNRLKVEADKPKLKVKIQSVSVEKDLLTSHILCVLLQELLKVYFWVPT